MAGWYYIAGDDWERHGPVTWEELQRLAASGKLQKDDAVWRPGEVAQVAASQIPELFLTIKPAPSPSPDEPPPLPVGYRGNKTSVPGTSRSLEQPPPFPPGFAKRSIPVPDEPPPFFRRREPTVTTAATGTSIVSHRVSQGPPAETSTPVGTLGSEQPKGTGRQQQIVNLKTLTLFVAGGIGILLLVVFFATYSGTRTFLRTVGANSEKTTFAVDGGIVHGPDGDYFQGDPQLRIGDPPTPEMKKKWDNTVYANNLTGDDYVAGKWQGSRVETVYYFKSNKLSRVELQFKPEELPLAVQAVAAKFGPPHYMNQPTFTTRNGALHQNEVVGWYTDAGRFELSKFLFRDDSSWSWQDGMGQLIPSVDPNVEQSTAVAESESSSKAETESQVIKRIRELGGSVELAYPGDDPAQSVVRVTFKDTQFTGAGLEHLESLSRLKELELDNSQITDAGLEHLKGLSQIEKLSLCNTKITDAGLEHLEGLTGLQELALCGTPITGTGLTHLKRLTQLQDLNLGGTQITDAGLEHLKGMTGLKYLDLGGTQITDAGLEQLGTMTQLKALNLRPFEKAHWTIKGLYRLCDALPRTVIRHY